MHFARQERQDVGADDLADSNKRIFAQREDAADCMRLPQQRAAVVERRGRRPRRVPGRPRPLHAWPRRRGPAGVSAGPSARGCGRRARGGFGCWHQQPGRKRDERRGGACCGRRFPAGRLLRRNRSMCAPPSLVPITCSAMSMPPPLHASTRTCARQPYLWLTSRRVSTCAQVLSGP